MFNNRGTARRGTLNTVGVDLADLSLFVWSQKSGRRANESEHVKMSSKTFKDLTAGTAGGICQVISPAARVPVLERTSHLRPMNAVDRCSLASLLTSVRLFAVLGVVVPR